MSSVERFDSTTTWGCSRAWGFRYIDGLKEPATKSQAEGSDVHEQLQHYTSTGEDHLGPVARAGKRFVHGPGEGLLVEHESLGDVSVAGVPFYVRMDLLNAGPYWLDDGGERRPQEGTAEVVDHKTTSDIAKWAKSGRALLGTTQMVTYGAWALRDGTAGAVRLSHCYYGTRKREALKSTVLATRAEVDDRLGAVAAIVERMKVAATARSGAELEPDTSKCERCHYAPVCPRPLHTRFASLLGLLVEPRRPTLTATEEDAVNLLDRLKSMSPPAGAPAPATPPVVGVVVPASGAAHDAELEAAVQRRLAELAAAGQGQPTLTGAAARAAVPDLPPGAGLAGSGALASTTVSDPRALAGVLPPDAPVSGTTAPKADPIPPETLATMPPAVQAAHAEVVSGTLSLPALPVTAPVTVPVAQVATPMTPVAKPSKPKRDRPPKAAETPAPTETVAPAPTGLVVFVDCAVSGVEARSLDGYVEDMLARLCESQGVIDVRCAPKDSPLAFGGWRGVVRALVAKGPPEPGTYSLRVGNCEVREEVAWGLQSVAGAVVARGVR